MERGNTGESPEKRDFMHTKLDWRRIIPLAVLDPRLPQFTEKSLFFRFYHCDPRMDGSFREMLISEHLSVLAGRISRLISDET